ncbi:MAG: LLM class F420-dependent oxidoreductase [Acidimicrobiia bacterium]
MQFGITMFATDISLDVRVLGRGCEERGFESLWLPEHTHIPTSRRSPWPGGDELPEEYWRTLDQFGALTAVAGVTERLLLATGICLVIEHDPITLAKQVATLDLLSGGRVLFGVGAGWNAEEMENHGTDPARRFRLLAERVAAMKTIWTNDVAEYHGELVDFDPIWQWPKPVRQPHPPVLVAGGGSRVLDRVLDYGDGGWLPIPGRGDFDSMFGKLQRVADERGVGPVPVSVFGTRPDPATVEHYRELGVTRCIFGVPSAPAEGALRRLDEYAELIAKFQ